MVSESDLRVLKWLQAKEYVTDDRAASASSEVCNNLGPDFLCIGAQKGGTTWLYDNLGYHPCVWSPPIKEINYFSSLYFSQQRRDDDLHRKNQTRDARLWWSTASHGADDREAKLRCIKRIEQNELTDAWYLDIFAYRGVDQIAGDISPNYSLLSRDGVRHAGVLNPGLRVICALRDPAERALSHARMLAGASASADDLWKVVKSDALSVLMAFSDYGRWLSRWEGVFGRDRMLLIYMNDIAATPLVVLRDVCRFLCIPFHCDLFYKAEATVFPGPKLNFDVEPLLHYLRLAMTRIYDDLSSDWPDVRRRFTA